MGKKVRKSRKAMTDLVAQEPRAVRIGSATSELPQPLQAAVDASGRWNVPRILREEVAIAILAHGHFGSSDSLAAPSRRNAGRSGARLSREEWQALARARADEITTDARCHPLLGFWLVPHENPRLAWKGLQNSFRRAIEAFAGHMGDARRPKTLTKSDGCDWRWLLPHQPEKKDLNGYPAFAEPMHLALWSWIRYGDASPTVQPEEVSKREIGKRVTALRDTILGDCWRGRVRLRKSGLLQVLAESFEPKSNRRQELVVAGSLERADGTRIDPRGLPMNDIETLLAGGSPDSGSNLKRYKIRQKLGLAAARPA